MNHATPFARLFFLLATAVIVGMVIVAQRGRKLFIRRIGGLTAIDEAVGRAAEMGRPILACTGLGGVDAPTLQALAIVSFVAEQAARFGSRVILPVYAPALLPVAEEAIRESYTRGGRPDSFRPDDVMFLSNRQFAFAAGAAGIINREKVASIFLFGIFFAEALVIAENGNRVGAIQIAGTPTTTQAPFFIAACDYVLIGDEFYAATAYLTRQPTLVGAIWGQDMIKGALLACIVGGALLVSFGVPLFVNLFADKPVAFHDLLHAVAAGGKR